MMEYYPPTKRNEVLIHAIPWMNLENTVVGEVSQMQNDNSCIIPLILDS